MGKVWLLSPRELFSCIQTAQSLSLLGEFSPSIMCSLFVTVILTVWAYMIYSQFEMMLENMFEVNANLWYYRN